MTYKIEEYSILSVTSYRLLDENGEYWYPLTLFLQKVLFKKIKAMYYRDNPKYQKFMKVIEYENPNSVSHQKEKTWFMSTEGICLIIQETKIYNGSPSVTMMRQKYLAATQAFFGITSKNEQEFIGFTPDLSNYDIWSIMCLTRDTTINNNTIWRRCEKCGFYYPYNKRYFQDRRGYLSHKCKQCLGLDFSCMNKKIQYVYKHNGLDLLYQLYLNDKDKIVEELKKWLG